MKVELKCITLEAGGQYVTMILEVQKPTSCVSNSDTNTHPIIIAVPTLAREAGIFGLMMCIAQG